MPWLRPEEEWVKQQAGGALALSPWIEQEKMRFVMIVKTNYKISQNAAGGGKQTQWDKGKRLS